MTSPGVPLSGPRVRLVPATRAVAAAVLGDPRQVGQALSALELTAADGWPHADTADALRPLAEQEGDAADAACWLITTTGEVVGECGWRPAVPGELELGYGLAVGARGEGLGTEAVGVLAAWADRQAGVRLLSAEVLVGNEPSRRLLSRLGFTDGGRRGDHLRLVRPVPPPAGRIVGRHVC